MIQVSVNRIKREPDQVNRINWIMNRIKREPDHEPRVT